ncbi:hypothetical protein B484DRAFT_459065, partial [Ochromonadaceae sp. CCMP2298]
MQAAGGGVGAALVIVLALAYWFFVCKSSPDIDQDSQSGKLAVFTKSTASTLYLASGGDVEAQWQEATVLDLGHLDLDCSDSDQDSDLEFGAILQRDAGKKGSPFSNFFSSPSRPSPSPSTFEDSAIDFSLI